MHYKTKTPAVSCRGSLRSSARRTRSEVALNANVEGNRILVLVLVSRGRLRSRRRDTSRGTGDTSELLVEVEVRDFRREGQVLHRGPAGHDTDHRHVVVGVAGEVRRDVGRSDGRTELVGRHVAPAPLTLRGGQVSRVAAVANRSPGTEQAGRPAGIPVVVERAA